MITPEPLNGWVENGQYVVDGSDMPFDVYYTLTATYLYNGKTYTATARMKKEIGSADNTSSSSYSETRKEWVEGEQYAADESYILTASDVCDGRTHSNSCTSIAAPAEADRHSRNHAAR